MKYLMFSLLVLLGALVLPLAVQASSDPIVAEIQRTYDRMRSLSGAFTQELRHLESGSLEKRNGTMLFEKPLNIRWETGDPFPELLIVTEKEIWDYLPEEELAYRYAPDAAQGSKAILQVITGQGRLDKDFDVEREADQDGLVILRLYPREPSTQMVEGIIAVDPATKMLRRAEIVDFYGNTNSIVFSRLTPDASIPPDAFSFTPPRGVAVEDKRKGH